MVLNKNKNQYDKNWYLFLWYVRTNASLYPPILHPTEQPSRKQIESFM